MPMLKTEKDRKIYEELLDEAMPDPAHATPADRMAVNMIEAFRACETTELTWAQFAAQARSFWL